MGEEASGIMEDKMRGIPESEYRCVQPRPLALVKFDPPPSKVARREEAKKAMARRTHDLVMHVTGGSVPRDQFYDWWADLRRGQLRIYGSLLRFIDLSVMKGVAREILQMIPQWLSHYIDEAYDAPTPPSARAA